MINQSIKNFRSSTKNYVFGRIFLLLVAFVAFYGITFAQDPADYEFSLYPRRMGNQLGVEIWVKSLTPTSIPLGDMSLPITYNLEYLTPAPEGEKNQPTSNTDFVINNPDIASPYQIISTEANALNGFGNIRVSVATPTSGNCGAATFHAELTDGGIGLIPADTGKGSFLGVVRFYIKKSVVMDDNTLAGFEFYNGECGYIKVLDATPAKNLVTDLCQFNNEPCADFTIRGITILNPTEYQTVNRYPAQPYASLSPNLGYPIYFERSGLIEPDKTKGVYGTPRYAYKVEYSLDDGISYTETGRVAESRNRSIYMTSEALQNANYSGMVDYQTADNDYYITTGSGLPFPADVANAMYLLDSPDGPGLDTMGYGGVIRIIWKADPNFAGRSENAKIRITQLTPTDANTNTSLDEENRPAMTDITRSGASVESFVLGRIFFTQLNGECQYFRSERRFSTPNYFTVQAWINLNNNNGDGSNPGIIGTSSGSAAPDGDFGGWLLYLKDGVYPAFRVRADINYDNYWLADIASTQPIGVYDQLDANGEVVITPQHNSNWVHVAATVAANIVTLYVDGEQVAQEVISGSAARPLNVDMPIWVGVNPDNAFEAGIDFLDAGIKEVVVWRTALSQNELRSYISGIPAPTKAKDTTKSLDALPNDPKAALSLYVSLQGMTSDLAYISLQEGANPLNYFTMCGTSDGATSNNSAVNFRPDGAHIKLTSPSCGEGVSNLKDNVYEIRWVAYGVGNNLPTPQGGAGDITISLSRDGGLNWFDAQAPYLYDEATGGTFSMSLDKEEVEAGAAMWEPYHNTTLTGIPNDLQGVFTILGNYEKNVRLRISGTAERNQTDIYAESEEFIVAPHFALVNRPTTQMTINGSQTLNITTQNAYFEAWIKPYSFPVEDATSPIIIKKDPVTDNLHYAIRLLPTGQIQFEYGNYDAETGSITILTANSDINPNYTLLNPNAVRYDSTWYHIGVYLNIPPNGTQSYVTFFIDGTPQTSDTIRTQLGSGLVGETKNMYPTYIGFEPSQTDGDSYFDGEVREVRFWRNNPGNLNDKDVDPNYPSTKRLYNFIQGAATVRANELIQLNNDNYAYGLIAAYSLDGGSWVNDGADGTIKVYPANSTLTARIFSACGDRQYAATYPLIKIVEPYAGQKVGNIDTVRVRWTGFDYNRNDLISFTTGTTSKRADLGISEGGGGGHANDYYPPVASLFENPNFINSMTLPTGANPFEFQGTKAKSQFAALLNMGLANSDVKGDKSYDEQGTVPAAQTNGRLQLFARANINSPDPLEYENGLNGIDGYINTLMAESPIFSITPPSNFTVRLLLEGYHKGLTAGINKESNLGTSYDANGLAIRFYQDESGTPGEYVANSYMLNKSSYSTSSKSTANRGKGYNNFANVPYTLTEAIDGKYFVLVDNLNYLPVMSAFASEFKYNGDDDTTWAIESGWDFQAWNGVAGNMLSSFDDPMYPNGKFTAYTNSTPTANRNDISGTWTLTPLNFNAGFGAADDTSPEALPAMVGGDIKKDGYIDVQDYQLIRDSGSGSGLARYNLKGYGMSNGTERTIVDMNMGKITSLYDLPEIFSTLYPDPIDAPIVNSGKTSAEINAEVDAVIKENAKYWINKMGEGFQAGIDYIVDASPFVNNNYVDVPIYITNVGSDWALANSSFAINYDPAILSFNGLVKANNVMFDNSTSAGEEAGYLNLFYAPTDKTPDPVANTYSIEVNFDARPSNHNTGLNVPNNRTYLGTLRFNLLTTDESIFFNWSSNSVVYDVVGRDITEDGNFAEIPPIIVNKKIELISPNGGEVFNGGQISIIEWTSPIMNTMVTLEYSTDNGSNWNIINQTPVPITTGKYQWVTPLIDSKLCLVRIVNATTTNAMLARSKSVFTITIPPTEIIRPASTDPTYIAGASDKIKWASVQPINVFFEFSADGVSNWIKVTDVVSALDLETPWKIPAVNTCNGVVRMVNSQTGVVVIVSEPFKLAAGSVNISNPKEGAKFAKNQKILIQWSASNVTNFNLEYTTDGINWISIANNIKATNRTYQWIPNNVVGTKVQIRAMNPTNDCIEYSRTGAFQVGNVSIDDAPVYANSITSISPNPVTDEANINFILGEDANVSVSIYDVYGKQVIEITNAMAYSAGEHSIKFNANNITAGVYMVRMQIGSKMIAKEFIKIK